jgi:CheY-like chemotaxis protein
MSPGKGPVRVLVAEDNPINQQVLSLMLQRGGCQVRVVGNGREALEALEGERFDLVLMDLQMPGMDGLRATRLLRARERAVGGRTPVVAVTANALPEERRRCAAAGMDDYLAKPLRRDELFGAIRRVLGVDFPGTEEGAPAPPPPGWLQALRSMRFDEKAIARLVRMFLDTTPGLMDRLREALAAGDAARVQSAAHTLKGALVVFSASASEAARRLEDSGRDKQLGEAAAPLAALEAEVRELEGSLAAFLEGRS